MEEVERLKGTQTEEKSSRTAATAAGAGVAADESDSDSDLEVNVPEDAADASPPAPASAATAEKEDEDEDDDLTDAVPLETKASSVAPGTHKVSGLDGCVCNWCNAMRVQRCQARIRIRLWMSCFTALHRAPLSAMLVDMYALVYCFLSLTPNCSDHRLQSHF